MNPQTYQVELTRADYAVGIAAVVAQLARRDSARTRLLFAKLAAIVVAFIIVMFLFPEAVPGLFVAALLVWICDSLVQLAFKTQTLGIGFDPAAHAAIQVAFDADGVAEQGAGRSRRWSWDNLRRVHLPPGHVVIEFAGWDMLVLPDRLWATQEERRAFVAELTQRQGHAATPSTPLPPREAEARLMLVEPVLVARIALVLPVFQLVFESWLPVVPRPYATETFVALGIALLAASITWLASGFAFRRLILRSPLAAIRTAWAIFALLATLFGLWFLGLI